MQNNSSADLLSLLNNVKKTQLGFVASCPVPTHGKGNGDLNPSLLIRQTEDGKVFFKCQAGCKTREILGVLGLNMHDLYRCVTDHSHSSGKQVNEPLSEEFRHKAYQTLIDQLELSPRHYEKLIDRGLSHSVIEAEQYRSISYSDRNVAAEAVFKIMGDDLEEIPGFERTQSGWKLYGSVEGIAIPVRDMNGRIQAIKIRSEGESRYSYLTGPNHKSSGSPIHVPVGIPKKSEVVRLTEGEFKATVAFNITKLPTIGIPGVSQWKKAIPIIEQLEANSVRIAYDSDFQTNRSVINPLKQAVQYFRENNFQISLETW